MSSSCFWSKLRFAAVALLLSAPLGGCVSKACPDGQKLKDGKCVDKNGAASHADADAGPKAEADSGAADAAAAGDAAARADAAAADADADADVADATDAAAACDLEALSCWQDDDHDGYAASAAASMSLACETKCPSGWTTREPVGDDVDCKDSDAKVRPRRCWRDADMDGYAADAHDISIFCAKSCGAGWTATEPKEDAIDCRADSALVAPGADEGCNGKDDDCDGRADEDADDSCSVANGTGACKKATCQVAACDSGFDDCDKAKINGCEQALNTQDNCGACGTACDPYATCGKTKIEGVGLCACDAPSFGDGLACHGPGPLAAGARWTFMIDGDLHLQYVGVASATIVTKRSAETQYRQIAIANTLGLGCGVTLAGKLDCWAGGVAPGDDSNFIQVVAGDAFVCALTSDHDPRCWGYGVAAAPYGEANPPDEKFTQLAAGFFHVCGLRADGKVVCWGAGSFARGSSACSDMSGNVHYDCGQAQPPTDKFLQITAGRFHSCGLKSDGSVKCWGIGVTSAVTPGAWSLGQAMPPADEVLTSISAGQWHTCGIRKEDGTAVCWGAGSGGSGQYDFGQSLPVDASYLVLSSGWFHTCGLTTQNRMICWGENSDGKAPPNTYGPFPLNPGR